MNLKYIYIYVFLFAYGLCRHIAYVPVITTMRFDAAVAATFFSNYVALAVKGEKANYKKTKPISLGWLWVRVIRKMMMMMMITNNDDDQVDEPSWIFAPRGFCMLLLNPIEY